MYLKFSNKQSSDKIEFVHAVYLFKKIIKLVLYATITHVFANPTETNPTSLCLQQQFAAAVLVKILNKLLKKIAL